MTGVPGHDVLRGLAGGQKDLARRSLRYRKGVITVAQPPAVQLGAGTVPTTNVVVLGSYVPTVGDTVACLLSGNTLLILGTEQGVSIHTPTLTNGWVSHGTPFNPVRVYKEGSRITISAVLNGLAATNFQAFVLPVGWRPAGVKYVEGASIYYTGTTWVAGVFQISGLGEVFCYDAAGAVAVRDYYCLNTTFYTQV
jgi:hypothetical protein